MAEHDREALLEELQLLKELLDILLQNPDFWLDDSKGFENYVNAVLDRMNEIKHLLTDTPPL